MASDALDLEGVGLAEEDWPAAHSMDTVWWGVDRHGRLARFATGEAGCVPEGAGGEPVEIDAVRALGTGARPVICDDLFPEPDGKLLMKPSPWDTEAEGPIEVDEKTEIHGRCFLLWLKDEAALKKVRSTKAGESAIQLTTPGKIVVWLATDWTRKSEEVSALAATLRWKKEGLLLRGWIYPYGELELERLGLFRYDLSDFDNWISGPYTREGLPKDPIRLTDLSEEMQKGLSACKLPDADFERDVLFQPYEHGEAYSWDERWVSTTGAVDPDEDDLDERPEPPELEVQIPGGSPAALVAAYLRGDADSAAVLGDWLEERGRARLPEADSPAERVDEVLLRWFTPEERLALEARFVEHLAEASLAPPEVAAVVSEVVAAVRQHLSGQAEPGTLMEKANAAFAAWMPEIDDDDEEEEEEGDSSSEDTRRIAWAGWALARQYPLVPGRTARALRPEELQYQVEQILAAIR